MGSDTQPGAPLEPQAQAQAAARACPPKRKPSRQSTPLPAGTSRRADGACLPPLPSICCFPVHTHARMCVAAVVGCKPGRRWPPVQLLGQTRGVHGVRCRCAPVAPRRPARRGSHPRGL